MKSGRFGHATDVMTLAPDGEVSAAHAFSDTNTTTDLLALSDDSLLLMTDADRDDGEPTLSSRAIGGQILWSRDLTGIERSGFRPVSLADGGLIMAGTYQRNPVVIRLSANGELDWRRRFRSANEFSRPLGGAVLGDSAVAITGSTGPGGGGFVSTDSDGFLIVSDGNGNGFAQYAGCTADAAEIDALTAELSEVAGIVVGRPSFVFDTITTPSSTLPPLLDIVPVDVDCGSNSEQHLVAFLRAVVNETHRLRLEKPSERASIRVTVRPPGVLDAGFREASVSQSLRVHLDVDHEHARAAVRYIATNVLPYTERRLAAQERLGEYGMRTWLPDHNQIGGGSASVREETETIEAFADLYESLDSDSKAQFRDRIERVGVVADSDLLHLWGDDWLLLGQRSVFGAFDFVTRTLPQLEGRIGAAEVVLEQRAGIQRRKSDPNLPHSDYADLLEQLVLASSRLSQVDQQLLRRMSPSIDVGLRFRSGVGMRGSRRQVRMTPAGVNQLFPFLIANSATLLAQDPQ